MNTKIRYVLVAVLVLGAAGLTVTRLFFGSDPAEVELADTTSAPSGDALYDGTWEVVAGSGDEDETFAGYRIDEEFAGVGANTAVGRTGDVEGTLTIDGDQITGGNITVDMTTLRSDKDMRDNALRDRGLETSRFPTAEFKLTEPITIGTEPAAGEKIDAQATGELTLHGVTKTLTIPIQARRSGDRITVISSFDVQLADYNIERPTTARVVSIADTGKVELQLHFSKQS